MLEDDASFRNLMVDVVSTLGYEAIVASDFREAERLLEVVDLASLSGAVLDCQLPENGQSVHNSKDVVALLRRGGYAGPIVCVSGRLDLCAEVARSDPLGMAICLPKPFNVLDMRIALDI